MPPAQELEALEDLVLDGAPVLLGDVGPAQAAHEALAGEGIGLVQGGQGFPGVPVEDLDGVILEDVEHDVVSVAVDGVHPALPGGLQHPQVVGLAVLQILAVRTLVIGAHLGGQEDPVGPHVDGRGHQLGGGLGDDLQRRLDIVAMALLDVGDQLPAADLVCDGDGGEGGEDDGDLLALQLLQDQLQMAQLPALLPWVQGRPSASANRRRRRWGCSPPWPRRP